MRKADSGVELGGRQAAAADAGLKAMIPIDRPFLDYVMSELADAGFERVCVVIGPEHDAVREHYVRVAPPRRIAIEFAVQAAPLGTADAVLAAEEFTGGEAFVVINSDNYYPADALTRLRKANPPALVAFARSALLAGGNVPPDRVGRFGALVIDESDNLVSITPRNGKPNPSRENEIYASMNCWLFDSRIFDACRAVPMSPRGELELPRAVQLAIDTMGMKFHVIRVSAAVLDMSTRADIASVQKWLAHIKPSY
jgi:glucose-1-phosphate thymidylyltransferase